MRINYIRLFSIYMIIIWRFFSNTIWSEFLSVFWLGKWRWILSLLWVVCCIFIGLNFGSVSIFSHDREGSSISLCIFCYWVIFVFKLEYHWYFYLKHVKHKIWVSLDWDLDIKFIMFRVHPLWFVDVSFCWCTKMINE
jgi:hypothetical protein